jgi:hypothetical protein
VDCKQEPEQASFVCEDVKMISITYHNSKIIDRKELNDSNSKLSRYERSEEKLSPDYP